MGTTGSTKGTRREEDSKKGDEGQKGDDPGAQRPMKPSKGL